MKVLRIPLLASIALLASCTSTWYPHRFAPSPLEESIEFDRRPQARARTLATVLGILRADPEEGRPARALVRLRLENIGEEELVLETASAQLLSAGLVAFGVPTLRGEGVAPDPRVEAGGDASVELAFPLPGGAGADQLDLSTVNLRWTIRCGEEAVTIGATFERWDRPSGAHARGTLGVRIGCRDGEARGSRRS